MALRKIITIENPILRQKAKKVTRFDATLKRLVEDMFETLHTARGVGLAAPQIAVSLRVLVAEYEERKEVLINPEIVKATGEEIGPEGCLSIPGYVGENIRRAAKVVVKGRDVNGKEIRVRADGWFARILQHEIDHLDGMLYIDRLDRPEDFRKLRSDEEDAGEVEPDTPDEIDGQAQPTTASAKENRAS